MRIDTDWGYAMRFRDLVFLLDACPYPVLIRVNLCNLWIFLKDWIPAPQAGMTRYIVCFGVFRGLVISASEWVYIRLAAYLT